jgi:hypothetical protein
LLAWFSSDIASLTCSCQPFSHFAYLNQQSDVKLLKIYAIFYWVSLALSLFSIVVETILLSLVASKDCSHMDDCSEEVGAVVIFVIVATLWWLLQVLYIMSVLSRLYGYLVMTNPIFVKYCSCISVWLFGPTTSSSPLNMNTKKFVILHNSCTATLYS